MSCKFRIRSYGPNRGRVAKLTRALNTLEVFAKAPIIRNESPRTILSE